MSLAKKFFFSFFEDWNQTYFLTVILKVELSEIIRDIKKIKISSTPKSPLTTWKVNKDLEEMFLTFAKLEGWLQSIIILRI